MVSNTVFDLVSHRHRRSLARILVACTAEEPPFCHSPTAANPATPAPPAPLPPPPYAGAPDGSYGDDDGHGTHVAGSAAGSLGGNGSSLATGAAPDARISFIDMGPPGSEAAPLGSLFIPPALEVNYLPVSDI